MASKKLRPVVAGYSCCSLTVFISSTIISEVKGRLKTAASPGGAWEGIMPNCASGASTTMRGLVRGEPEQCSRAAIVCATHHAVNFAILVCDDGEVHFHLLRLAHVLQPVVVVLDCSAQQMPRRGEGHE
jgi:hypothetical protein